MFVRIVVLFLFLSLSACGFRPIHGEWSSNSETDQALASVDIGAIQDRTGQQLRNYLIDRFYLKGRPVETTSTLDVVLRSNDVDLGVQKDSTSSRQEHNLTAAYVLRDKSGAELLKGEARSIVSYTKLPQQYGTVAAKKNASDRAVEEVGAQITNRLLLYFAEHKKSQGDSRDAGPSASAQEPVAP